MVGGSNPLTPISSQDEFVNHLVNTFLAMLYERRDHSGTTEFMLGPLQIGTPTASQKWVDEFLGSRRQGLADRTFEDYRDILYVFVGTDLTPKAINAWLASLKAKNAKLNHYEVVKVFCTWLHRSGKIKSNPASLVDKPKTKKTILPAITPEELDTLLLSTENVRDKCILNLLYDSGVRLGELVGIKDTNFDWEKRIVIVDGKTGPRKAPFTEDTGTMLQLWFTAHKTFEVNAYGVQSMLRRLREKTGIRCNAHAFRRGFANAQFRKGLSTKVVMKLGGWTDIKTVDKYSREFSQEDALEQYNTR